MISTAWNALMRQLQSYTSNCSRVIECKSQGRRHTDLVPTSKAAHFYTAIITFKQHPRTQSLQHKQRECFKRDFKRDQNIYERRQQFH